MTTNPTTPDYAAIKQKQQATWATGDYARIGATLQIVGERLCEAVVEHQGRHAPQRVDGAEFVGIAETRPGLVFERHFVQRQGNADAADKGAVILADQDHLMAGTARR